jgi:hypothetical protein
MIALAVWLFLLPFRLLGWLGLRGSGDPGLLAGAGRDRLRRGRGPGPARPPRPGQARSQGAGAQSGCHHRAGNAWARFGRDFDRDGRVSVYDPADAIPAAAHYLCAHGARRSLDRALFAYNHSWTYVARVKQLTRRHTRHAGAGQARRGRPDHPRLTRPQPVSVSATAAAVGPGRGRSRPGQPCGLRRLLITAASPPAMATPAAMGTASPVSLTTANTNSPTMTSTPTRASTTPDRLMRMPAPYPLGGRQNPVTRPPAPPPSRRRPAHPLGVGGGERPHRPPAGPGAGLDQAAGRGLLRPLRHRTGPQAQPGRGHPDRRPPPLPWLRHPQRPPVARHHQPHHRPRPRPGPAETAGSPPLTPPTMASRGRCADRLLTDRSRTEGTPRRHQLTGGSEASAPRCIAPQTITGRA